MDNYAYVEPESSGGSSLGSWITDISVILTIFFLIAAIILVIATVLYYIYGRQNLPTIPCKSDGDCRNGEVCINGGCQLEICTTTDDCAALPGTVCLSGVCAAPRCIHSNDCPVLGITGSTGVTGTYMVCIEGLCYPNNQTCINNSDCRQGFCNNNVCINCLNTGDCGLGEGCINNICQYPESASDATPGTIYFPSPAQARGDIAAPPGYLCPADVYGTATIGIQSIVGESAEVVECPDLLGVLIDSKPSNVLRPRRNFNGTQNCTQNNVHNDAHNQNILLPDIIVDPFDNFDNEFNTENTMETSTSMLPTTTLPTTATLPTSTYNKAHTRKIYTYENISASTATSLQPYSCSSSLTCTYGSCVNAVCRCTKGRLFENCVSNSDCESGICSQVGSEMMCTNGTECSYNYNGTGCTGCCSASAPYCVHGLCSMGSEGALCGDPTLPDDMCYDSSSLGSTIPFGFAKNDAGFFCINGRCQRDVGEYNQICRGDNVCGPDLGCDLTDNDGFSHCV